MNLPFTSSVSLIQEAICNPIDAVLNKDPYLPKGSVFNFLFSSFSDETTTDCRKGLLPYIKERSYSSLDLGHNREYQITLVRFIVDGICPQQVQIALEFNSIMIYPSQNSYLAAPIQVKTVPMFRARVLLLDSVKVSQPEPTLIFEVSGSFSNGFIKPI